MELTRRSIRILTGIAVLGLLPLMTACGDGGGEPVRLCNPFTIVLTGQFDCSPNQNNQGGSSGGNTSGGTGGSSNSGNTGGTGGSGGPGGSGGTTSAMINQFSEFEPNNTLDNANVVQFPAAGNMVAGLHIHGSVHDTDDPSDFFIVTPRKDDLFLIHLCADTCLDSVVDDSVYIMVYDQNQTTIASTPIGTAEEQRLLIPMSAGLAYYIEVHGYATDGQAYPYDLSVIE